MTVNTKKVTSGPYAGNDIADTFSYTFKVDDKTELSVFETNSSGVETLLTVDTDYTVAGVGDDGGGILTRVAGALPTGYEWYIRSNYEETQLTAFSSQGPFFPDLHEFAMDKLTFLIQQLLDEKDRSPSVSKSYSGPLPLTLDNPVAQKILRWKSDLSGLENIGVSEISPGLFPNDAFTLHSTLSVVIASTDTALGQVYILSDRANSTWDIVAGVVGANTRNIVAHDTLDLSAVLRIEDGVHNVKEFGAAGDGVTVDNLVINDTVLIASQAQGSVYFPASIYICGQFHAKSDILMFGDGFGSILKDDPNKVDPSDNKVLMRMYGTSPDPADNISNVTVRDLHFLGNVFGDGFKEFKHLILIQGATNIKFVDCIFNSWQGDAIVVRAGNDGWKNRNVTIHNNVFAGGNGNNRQCVSINDADGLWITDNSMSNCARDGSPTYDYVLRPPYDVFDPNEGPAQPGAIDIEPNETYSFSVLRHIVISGNNFRDIGGNVACVGAFLPLPTEDFLVKPNSWKILNNTMINVYRGFNFTQLQAANVADSYPSMDISIINNSVKNATDRAFFLYGMKGISMRDNFFEDCPNASRIGWIGNFRRCNDVELINNKFRHCGLTDGGVVNVYASDRINFTDNTIDNCGASGGGFGVPFTFAEGESSKVKFVRNDFVNNEGLMTGAISFVGETLTIDGTWTVNLNGVLFSKLMDAGIPANDTVAKVFALLKIDIDAAALGYTTTVIGSLLNVTHPSSFTSSLTKPGATAVPQIIGYVGGVYNSNIEGRASIAAGSNLMLNNDFLGFDVSAFPFDYTEHGEFSFEGGIVATGANQAAARQLTKVMNVVIGGAAFTGVKLPTSSGDGKVVTVSNLTAGSIQVFPFVGDDIGKGLNAPESIATGSSKTYKSYGVNNWIKTTL
tara:strand:- start:596 stop:3310 length:2715 start_codon:yes stop_codon:yes gene_type:complete